MLADQPNSGNNELKDMVTTFTSTMDDGVALHENLLNAPRNLFTTIMVTEEEEEPLPDNLLLMATMVTNENVDESKNTKMAEVRKKKKKTV